MFAFASPASVTAPASSTFVASCARPRATPGPASGLTMTAKSTATPFLAAQPNLAGWAGDQASFDPLGLSNLVDMRFLREAEVKHCRIAMLAILGLFVADVYRLPIYASAPSGLQAAHDWGVAQGPMVQLLLWISGLELIVGVPALVQMMGGSERKAGDFHFDPMSLGKMNIVKDTAYAELVNGRLAMIACGAVLHHEFLTGQGAVKFVGNGLGVDILFLK